MMQLKPDPDNSFACPECKAPFPVVKEILFESVNVMAHSTCATCGFEFYQVLPVGHTSDYTFSIGKESRNLYQSNESPVWLADSLLKAHNTMRQIEVPIEKVIFHKRDNVIILNTLDSLYGHVLLKLYNAFYHLERDKEKGLIIIIPKIFTWLIPKGCAEVWIVDLKLSDFVFGYESIQRFVSKELYRFKEVQLSKAYSHPEFSSVNIQQLTGVAPFQLETFSQRKPTITFIVREDRWWYNGIVDYWFYRVCRKFKILPWGSHILSLRQNTLIKKTILRIRKELPEAIFNIIGLGTTGSFKGYATDERQTRVDAEVETAWCKTYAQSHVVIGIHGSNMLLPTALSAGCVEILPEDRYGNMIQDISVRYTDRRQLFFYRFVDQFARPQSVGGKATAMIRDYAIFYKNMCSNVYPITQPYLKNDTHLSDK